MNIFRATRKVLFVMFRTQIELDYTMKRELKPFD